MRTPAFGFLKRKQMHALGVGAVGVCTVLTLSACVETSEASKTPTVSRTKVSVGSITQETTAQQDWKTFTDLGSLFLEQKIVKRCGRIASPKPISGMGVKGSRDRAKQIEKHIAVLPSRISCANNNIHVVSKEFFADVAQKNEVRALMRKKIAAGFYNTKAAEYTYIKRQSVSTYPNFETYEKQLGELQLQLATEEQRAKGYLSAQARDVGAAKSKRNSIIMAGVSAGIKGAAQNSRTQAKIATDAQVKAGGPPPMLTKAERQALQAAYYRSLANVEKTPLESSSGSNGGGATLTLSSSKDWDCNDPNDVSSPCTENIARRDREQAVAAKRLAEQKAEIARAEADRKRQAAEDARKDAERRAHLKQCGYYDHHNCGVASEVCHDFGTAKNGKCTAKMLNLASASISQCAKEFTNAKRARCGIVDQGPTKGLAQ